jgi:hypothetical protein
MIAPLLTVLLSLLGRELWGWLPTIARAVIWLITLPLPRKRRARRREEWAAHLHDEFDERRLAGLFWVLQLSRVCVLELGRQLLDLLLLGFGWLRERSLIGVDRRVVRLLPSSERARLHTLNMAVLLICTLAGVSLAFAASTAFSVSPLIATLVGIGWGALVLVIERLVHALPPSDGGSGPGGRFRRRAITLLVVIPRLALCVLLAVATAEPLLLQVFDREISVSVGRTRGVSIVDRLQALSALAAAHPGLRVIDVLLQLTFVALFCLPLVVGVYMRRFRTTQYRFYL